MMEVLIAEIQKRNVLWNKRNSRYKDRLVVDKEYLLATVDTDDEILRNLIYLCKFYVCFSSFFVLSLKFLITPKHYPLGILYVLFLSEPWFTNTKMDSLLQTH